MYWFGQPTRPKREREREREREKKKKRTEKKVEGLAFKGGRITSNGHGGGLATLQGQRGKNKIK